MVLKIFAKVRAFSGGAPISFLEYLKILQKNGYSILVGAECTNNGIEEKYRSNKLDIVDIKALNKTGLIGKISTLLKCYNLIIESDIQGFMVTTGVDIFFFSYIAELLDKPIIINVAGGKITEKYHFVSKWGNHRLICYSKENYNDLIKIGYEKEKISVITNRITLNNIENANLYRNLRADSQINISIISRIDTSKINSIHSVIELTKFLVENGKNIKLRIAGDGPLRNNLRIEINEINKQFGENIIELLGFIDKPERLISESHIVFGKGRSVIEAVMMNRVGVVVNEDSTMAICNKESFENLLTYNFSGRNMVTKSSFEDIICLVDEMRNGTFDVSNYEKVVEQTRLKYSAEYLERKFKPIFNSELISNSEGDNINHFVNKMKIIWRVFLYYSLRIFNRFRKEIT